MALEKVTTVTGRAVFVPGADIDTDRIIPARFMKCVTFDGLGEFAFYDVRFDPNTGEKTDHPLNDERFKAATILLAGVNFGCGSSREHAPQSLNKRVRSSTGLDFGFNMPESARDALVAGRWDPIQELLDRESDIATKAKELHYV